LYIATDVNAFLSGRISSELSPWRLAATAVQLQFGLRQLGRAMAHDSTRQAASMSLDKMMSMLFHHSMASDEAYFIAEMAKGIDGSVAEKVIFICRLACFTLIHASSSSIMASKALSRSSPDPHFHFHATSSSTE